MCMTKVRENRERIFQRKLQTLSLKILASLTWYQSSVSNRLLFFSLAQASPLRRRQHDCGALYVCFSSVTLAGNSLAFLCIGYLLFRHLGAYCSISIW